MVCDKIGVGYDRNTLTESQRKAKINELVDKCMAILNNHEYGVVLDVLDELQAEVEMSRLVARGKEG
jgi:hypothetical protein